jgi:hypothetical protein
VVLVEAMVVPAQEVWLEVLVGGLEVLVGGGCVGCAKGTYNEKLAPWRRG